MEKLKPDWAQKLRIEHKDNNKFGLACCGVMLDILHKKVYVDSLQEVPLANGIYKREI